MKVRKIVASIIIIYNLIGLIALFGLYPNDPFYWDGSMLLFDFTFPITVIGFALRYVESGYPLVVVTIQLIILAITLFFGDVITKCIIGFKKK